MVLDKKQIAIWVGVVAMAAMVILGLFFGLSNLPSDPRVESACKGLVDKRGWAALIIDKRLVMVDCTKSVVPDKSTRLKAACVPDEKSLEPPQLMVQEPGKVKGPALPRKKGKR